MSEKQDALRIKWAGRATEEWSFSGEDGPDSWQARVWSEDDRWFWGLALDFSATGAFSQASGEANTAEEAREMAVRWLTIALNETAIEVDPEAETAQGTPSA